MTTIEKQKIFDTVDQALNIDSLIKENKTKRKNNMLLTGTAILFFVLGITVNAVTGTMQSDEAFIKENFVVDDRKLLESIQAEKAQTTQPVYFDDLPEIEVTFEVI